MRKIKIPVVCLLVFQLLCTLMGHAAGIKAALIYDPTVPQFQFAASEIKREMQHVGYSITDVSMHKINSASSPLRIIITTLSSPETKRLLKSPTSLPAEGFMIQRESTNGVHKIWIIGADNVGAMYGCLEVAEWAKLNGNLDHLQNVLKSPYIANRGIKFNIPLDARTPSYTDAGESARLNIENMWDEKFWHEFIDQMARDRLNTLTLWNLHPFPSMVKVPEYPKVALNDVKKPTVHIASELKGNGFNQPSVLNSLQTIKKITIDDKIKFWQKIMKYGSERGVSFYILTWNLFIYGTEESGYNFTDAMTDEKTIDYFRKSVKALVKTYPLLKGIGITAGENMFKPRNTDKEAWLWKTYGLGINDALEEDKKRVFTLIHRAHQTSPVEISKTFAQLNPRCVFDYEYKYSQAHMYASPKPLGIYSEKILEETPIENKLWLTCRDDDYYMFRWADADFMRSFVKNMPVNNNRIKGVLLGADGYNWGREYISKEAENPRPLVIKKKWFSLMSFGRLSYDPEDLSHEQVLKTVEKKYPGVEAQPLLSAWTKASRIIPMVSQFHHEMSTLDYQWYPEACLKFSIVGDSFSVHTVDNFISYGPQPGSNMIGIRDFVSNASQKESDTAMLTPPEVAAALKNLADDALNLLQAMPKNNRNKELNYLLGDIEAMSYLGHYYSLKISGALNKALFESTGKAEYRQMAIAHLKDASKQWKIYAAKATSMYQSQYLNRFLSRANPRRVDLVKLQSDVDNDILLAGGTIEENKTVQVQR
jgi:hypothetical protein